MAQTRTTCAVVSLSQHRARVIVEAGEATSRGGRFNRPALAPPDPRVAVVAGGAVGKPERCRNSLPPSTPACVRRATEFDPPGAARCPAGPAPTAEPDSPPDCRALHGMPAVGRPGRVRRSKRRLVHRRQQLCSITGVVLSEPVQFLDGTAQFLGHVVQRHAVAVLARGVGRTVRVERQTRIAGLVWHVIHRVQAQ